MSCWRLEKKSTVSNHKQEDFILIIVAAGTGTRMFNQEDIKKPKQFLEIAGKPLLLHTLMAFEEHKALDKIVIAINPDYADDYVEICKNISKPVEYVNGGKTRQESVANVLEHLKNQTQSEQIILIHDAARPLITHADIDALLHALQSKDAATLSTPVSDTLRHKNGDDIPRDNIHAIQTPQAFRYDIIKKAHEQFKDEPHTDDAGLAIKSGVPVEFVTGGRHNIKVTYPEDLLFVNTLLSTHLSTEVRTGQGFDVHAFDNNDTESVDKVRLCGVDIPHSRKLLGHSDADVGLHALTDAIYGAIGEGDIGLHFPPSNNDFKDMDSAIFLEHAMQMLRDKGGKLINADITLMCEAPKIGPHREAITSRVAEILSVEKSRINIKATTTEKLGFTGREEGIAAQAIVSVSLPLQEAGND